MLDEERFQIKDDDDVMTALMHVRNELFSTSRVPGHERLFWLMDRVLEFQYEKRKAGK